MVTLRPSLLKYTHTTNLLLSMIFSRMEGCAAKYKRNVEKLLVCQLIPFPLSFPLHIFPLILYFFYIIAAKTPKPTSFCTHKNLDSYSYLFFFVLYWILKSFSFALRDTRPPDDSPFLYRAVFFDAVFIQEGEITEWCSQGRASNRIWLRAKTTIRNKTGNVNQVEIL